MPLLTPYLSSLWLHLVTPVKAGVARPLIEGLRNETVVRDDRIRELVPIELTPFDAAAREALGRLEPFDGVGFAEAKVDRVASSRRIITPDGKFHGRMSSAKDPALRALPEGAIDPMLRTVTLFASNRPLVRMHFGLVVARV